MKSLVILLLLICQAKAVLAATYNLSDLPVDQKSSICQKNVAFCDLTCAQGVVANTCDISTMTFECACVGGLPVSKYYFPVNAQQCVGENQECRDACFFKHTSNTDMVTSCSNACDAHFACGTPTSGQVKNLFTTITTSTSTTTSAVPTPSATSTRSSINTPVSNEAPKSVSSFALIPFMAMIYIL